MTNGARVVWWVRTDLRLHDNVALAAALELKPECLYPIWTWDPHYVYHTRVSPNRWRFLLDCQTDLSNSIKERTGHNGLLVLRGNPLTCIEQVIKDWKISHLVFEKDTDTYAQIRDSKVMDLAKSMGVKVITRLGRTLYDPEAMTKLNGGKAIYNISTIQKLGPQTGEIPRPIPSPDTLPRSGDTRLYLEKDDSIETSPDLNEPQRVSCTDNVTCYERIDGPNSSFCVPTMEELNMKPALGPHRGGETLALAGLAEYMADKKKTATFEKPKTNPGVFLPPETTLLSPHLHFGSLSIRKFYWDIVDVVTAYGPAKSSHPPVSLTGQLFFRDMYFAAQFGTPHYERTEGNAHCRYIPWKCGNTYDADGTVIGYDRSDETANEYLARWRSGTTGWPWIDAIMRQLARDGWIHHLARHSVACFLTRGHLYISWERGADVFEELLIDHETACNVGNWQWLSCTAFFSQFYRVYSPVAFGKKHDPKGGLIREYVPELKDVPDKYIYEPWKMSKVDQKAANVVIGDRSPGAEQDGRKTYPKPMLDLQEAAKASLAGMKASYAAKIYGDDARVPSGAAKRIIEGSTEGPPVSSSPTPMDHDDSNKKKRRKGEQGSMDRFAKRTKGGRETPKEEHEENEQNNV